MTPQQVANFFLHIPKEIIENKRAKSPDFIEALLLEGVWLEEVFIVPKKKMEVLMHRYRPSDKPNSNQQTITESQAEPALDSSILRPIKNFAGSMKNWVSNGMPLASKEVYETRKSICNSCPFWDKDGNMGMGKCKQCGCTAAKLSLATEKCPVGKWGPVTKD
jgi:hypothetical protein